MDPNLQPPDPHGTPLLRILALLLFAFVVVVLSSLGAYWYLNNRMSQQNQQQVYKTLPATPTPTVSIPTETISPTTNPQQKNVVTSCSMDSDCSLVNKEQANLCCLNNDDCGRVDFSLEKWIAINKEKTCNSKQEIICPPVRGCHAQPINDQFKAKCINNVCAKILLTPL